jgi:hypothetical protein
MKTKAFKFPQLKELKCEKYFDISKFQHKELAEEKSQKIQLLGMLVKRLHNTQFNKKKEVQFLEKCKEVLESGVVINVLQPPSEMELIPYDTVLNRFVNKDRSAAIIDYHSMHDLRVSNKEDLQHRKMLIFYFYTNLSKDELNEKFGFGFNNEGELPKEWSE